MLNAIALNISPSPTISGMKAVRAGIDSASTVPFRNPTQMKSKKVTLPVMMMIAITSVATPFSACDQSSSGFLRTRSASTPPMREKNICGAVKAKVTKARIDGGDGHLVHQPALRHELHVHGRRRSRLDRSTAAGSRGS